MKSYIRERKISYFAAFMTMAIAAIGISAAGRFIGGERSILYSDLAAQYIPTIKSFWRAVFTHEDLKYSFSIGLGMPSIANYTGCSFSPFNILYILIPEAELATTVLIIMKYGLAAYAFSRMLSVMTKSNNYWNSVFASCYALCGYATVFSCNIHLLEGMYILPLIVRFGYELIRENRSLKLCIAYTYAFITQFYEGYIVGVISFGIFLVSLFIIEEQNNTKFKSILKYILSVVIAALVSGIVLVPTAYLLFHSYSENTQTREILAYSISEFLGGFWLGINTSFNNNSPVIYSSILSILVVPLFFASKKIMHREKVGVMILLLFLALCCTVKPLYMLIHVFDIPDGFDFRFSFFFPFVLCYMGARALSFKSSIKKIYIVLIGGVYMLAGLYLVGQNAVGTYKKWLVIINVLLVIGYIVCLLGYSTRKKCRIIIGMLTYVELSTSIFFIFSGLPQNFVNDKRQYNQYVSQVETALESVDTKTKRVAGEAFMADPLYFGYMGNSLFSSLDNNRVRDFLKEIGYATGAKVMIDDGGTRISRLLLGEAYRLVYNLGEDGGIKNVELLEDISLPLAYMTSDSLKTFSFDDYHAPNNINRLVSVMCGEERLPIEIYSPVICEEGNYAVKEDIHLEEETLFVPGIYLRPGKYTFIANISPGEVATYHYQIETQPGKNNYAFFIFDQSLQLQNSPAVSSSGKKVRFENNHFQISRNLKLGNQEGGELSITFPRNGLDMVYYNDFVVFSEDDEEIEKVYQKLLPGAAKNVRRKGTKIDFDIEVSEGYQTLFLSIPYDEGWHILVDGSETEIAKLINETFLGAGLPVGEHHISLYYDPIANKVGIWTSIVGLIFLSLLIVWDRKNKKLLL